MPKKDRYAEAGVDIDKAHRFIEALKPLAKKTHTSGVITDIGGFGGLFHLNTSHYNNPVLVSSTDGVGTKLKIACLTKKHDTIGIDLVAMCVNDIIVLGAKPLFFMDYLAMGRLDEAQALEIMSGITTGCRQAKMALLGGETAEMPGHYPAGEYDLAGFVVGVVEDEKVVDGASIRVGDVIIGVASSGLHSNGYSLARRIFLEEMGLGLDEIPEGLETSLAEELLKPTKIYTEQVRNLLRDLTINGMAHITGGGLTDNLPRILPKRCRAEINEGSWVVPPVFEILQRAGGVSQDEMYRTFNCGIGLILVVPEDQADETLDRLAAMDEPAWAIGRVASTKKKLPSVSYI